MFISGGELRSVALKMGTIECGVTLLCKNTAQIPPDTGVNNQTLATLIYSCSLTKFDVEIQRSTWTNLAAGTGAATAQGLNLHLFGFFTPAGVEIRVLVLKIPRHQPQSLQVIHRAHDQASTGDECKTKHQTQPISPLNSSVKDNKQITE